MRRYVKWIGIAISWVAAVGVGYWTGGAPVFAVPGCTDCYICEECYYANYSAAGIQYVSWKDLNNVPTIMGINGRVCGGNVLYMSLGCSPSSCSVPGSQNVNYYFYANLPAACNLPPNPIKPYTQEMSAGPNPWYLTTDTQYLCKYSGS